MSIPSDTDPSIDDNSMLDSQTLNTMYSISSNHQRLNDDNLNDNDEENLFSLLPSNISPIQSIHGNNNNHDNGNVNVIALSSPSALMPTSSPLPLENTVTTT